MRRILALALIALGGLASVEAVSSYVLFRYYAHAQKSMLPTGSAAWMLLDGTVKKARGIHPLPTLSVDHGQLFDPSETLGYVLHPGRYRIKEQLDRKVHVFELKVTDEGARATSYVPVRSGRRIFMAGDSSMFGWGLNDEQTIPWLMQARLPGIEVVNLSLTSYSTVHALLQLQQADPKVGPNDVVVIEYHQLSNKLNVEAPDVLENFKKGYEFELGDRARMREAQLPFGAIDGAGEFSIHHLSLSCVFDSAAPNCARPPFDVRYAMQVTEQAFDEIMALHPGHLVVVFLSGADADPVIEHLRSRGAVVADLRGGKDGPVEEDVIFTDSHLGPFGQYQLAERLFELMRQNRIVD
ncbi:MAG: hypothetical protein JWN43_946 [Gammaproteobacteria bacterium]|nr:hypothetical protein [Gammaproteobacteria bacterium]